MERVLCICGHRYTASGHRSHRKKAHVRCCETIFVGEAWLKHHNTTGHNGEKVSTWTKRPARYREKVECELGCGLALQRDRMKRHHKSEYYRCTECDRIFISTGKKEHEHSTKHVSYMLFPSLDREHAGAAAAASTQRTHEPGMPRESIETVQMRTKYGSMIQDLLRECRNSKNSQLGHTRWEDSLTLLNRIFPSDRDIPIARIGPISTTADDADVWYTTEDDIERMMAQNFILRKPTVVRSRQLGRRAQRLDHFLEALNDHFGDSKVDVQDPSTKKKAAVPLPVCDIIDRIREGADIPAGRLPINLLNLKYLGQVPPAPAFLNLRRFDILPAISSRLEAELTGQAIAGKRGHAVMVEAREVDLDRSLTFSLFAQRGAFTGFHVDSPDATWVFLEWGLKLWIFATDTNESEMVKFTDEGDNWVPERVVAIVLEPGDTLIMPSAQLLPHAVLTLADSRMTGGMFMDALRILESIEKLLWISIRPSVSNEPIPLQLLRGWSHLRKLFYDRNQSTTDRARFEKITGLLCENLSCQCTGTCGKSCLTCRCSSSVAQDQRCTPWCRCHAASTRKKSRASKRTAAGSG